MQKLLLLVQVSNLYEGDVTMDHLLWHRTGLLTTTMAPRSGCYVPSTVARSWKLCYLHLNWIGVFKDAASTTL